MQQDKLAVNAPKPRSTSTGAESSLSAARKRPAPQATEEDVVEGPPPKKVVPPTPAQAKNEIASLQTAAEKVARAIQLCRTHPSLARYVLGQVKNVTRVGWCSKVSMAGNKGKGSGYVQLSYWGANKFAVLHRVVCWAGGQDLAQGQEGSHLCENTDCSSAGHIVPEDSVANQGRKGCVGWMDCPCGDRKLLLCTHQPACIRYCVGFDSQEEFLREGICHRRAEVHSLEPVR